MSGRARKADGLEPPADGHAARAAEMLEREQARFDAAVDGIMVRGGGELDRAFQEASSAAPQRWRQAAEALDDAEVRAAFLAGFEAGRGSYMSDMPTALEALAIWEAGR